jgi:hypothetical protein
MPAIFADAVMLPWYIRVQSTTLAFDLLKEGHLDSAILIIVCVQIFGSYAYHFVTVQP